MSSSSSSSPVQSSSNINTKQSEQRLNEELNNITPVIESVIKSLYNSYQGTDNSQTLPMAKQLLSALPQLHSVLENESTQKSIKKVENIVQQSIDQNLKKFDRLIETPLVQQFLTTIDADPNQIKKAVHMHNATIHQRLTAFEPIVNAVENSL